MLHVIALSSENNVNVNATIKNDKGDSHKLRDFEINEMQFGIADNLIVSSLQKYLASKSVIVRPDGHVGWTGSLMGEVTRKGGVSIPLDQQLKNFDAILSQILHPTL